MTNLIDSSSRTLAGKEGLSHSVGPLAYGCWRLVNMSVADAQARIETALECGMNLIDTANVYGLDWGGAGFGDAEQLLGQVMSAAPALREQMVLATKGGIIPGVPYDSAYLREACEASLERLGVEQVDLYQIHRPDLLSHPQEVARTLEDLVASGKVGSVGVSNYQPSQIDALLAHLDIPLTSHQPEYSALHLDPLFNGVFDQCMAHNLTALVWSPLGGGRLANENELSDELKGVMGELCAREGADLPTLALAFVLAHPARPIAIVGSTNLERIRGSVKALELNLNRADVYSIIQASMGEALP